MSDLIDRIKDMARHALDPLTGAISDAVKPGPVSPTSTAAGPSMQRQGAGGSMNVAENAALKDT